MIEHSVHREPPEGFHPNLYVSGCYCEYQGKVLFLKRHPERPQGGTWGVPAGKMEKNETARMTVVREVLEEVGFDIDDEGLKDLGALYCRLPHVDYIFHMFYKSFPRQPEVKLALNEHLEALWVTPEEALKLPLIVGGVEALNYMREKVKR